MIQAINTSSTGLNASQALLDVTSNNLANLNTTGFKANQVAFQDLFYASVTGPGAATGQVASAPVGTQVGLGVRLAGTAKMFTQGPLQNTGQPLDVAIQGNGFFQVTRPDGSVAYTRDGSFRLDPSGRLVTADGSLVQPSIVVPPGATAVTIAADGTVTANVGGSSVSAQVVGQLTLVNFPNAPGLTSVGNNLYAASAASGNPTTAVPGQGGTGTLAQGLLEGSNVNPTTELVNLLIAQQTYASNTRAILIASQMLSDTVDLIS
jgi:flagellar basal-body rod protein FlgG